MIILASSSPRRSELLRNAAIPFRVKPGHVPESPNPGETPLDYCQRLALDKARAVQPQFPDCYILGADTVVIVDEHLLEKPQSNDDAVRMLHMMTDRAHLVTTGVCLIAPGGKVEDVRCETTEVTFTAISDAEIRSYVATGEPIDKAGAYGIQGVASRWVKRVDGCFYNVMGLPISLVYRMLREHKAI
jgi:septum formation protein